MSRRPVNIVGRFLVGLVAGAVGFYGGLFLVLSIWGLDGTAWAPSVMLAGASLFGTAAVMIAAGCTSKSTTIGSIGASIGGALIGLVIDQLGNGFELSILSAVAIIAGGVGLTRSRDEGQRSRH